MAPCRPDWGVRDDAEPLASPSGTTTQRDLPCSEIDTITCPKRGGDPSPNSCTVSPLPSGPVRWPGVDGEIASLSGSAEAPAPHSPPLETIAQRGTPCLPRHRGGTSWRPGGCRRRRSASRKLRLEGLEARHADGHAVHHRSDGSLKLGCRNLLHPGHGRELYVGASVVVYRDSNNNGSYDAGSDAFAGGTVVLAGNTPFTVGVSLTPNATNRFFTIADDGSGVSNVVNVPVITEDSIDPTVSSIVLAGASPTNASSVSFTVTFSENVTEVDATDFSINASGVLPDAAVTVGGSGNVYTVTVTNIVGNGTVQVNLTDDDSIVDEVVDTPFIR